MKKFTIATISKIALFSVTLAILSACSASCHCPTCPNQSQTPTTTIIHEPNGY